MTSREDRRRCRNCGKPAGPSYCGYCGQALETKEGPFWATAKELLSDWISLDSRLLRSARCLLTPGRLSELYVAGKRAPYLRPFRLYLLASLAVFSTVLALGTLKAEDYDIYLGDQLVSPQRTEGSERGTLQLFDTRSAFGRWASGRFSDRIDKLRGLPPQEILDTVFSAMQRFAPLTLIFAVPFLALGLKLLYLRRKVLYLHHLVFALHFQSALFFALATAWLCARLFSFGLTASLFAYVAVWLGMMTIYQAIALRRFYGQRWWLTIAKTFVVTFAYLQALSFALGATMFLTLWRI